MEKKHNPEESPYFDHWAYTGNPIQRALKIGPRKAVYRKWDGEALKAALEDGSDEMELPLVVGGDAKKAVPLHRWMLDWAEGRVDAKRTKLYKSPWVYRCVQIRARGMAAINWSIIKDDKENPDCEFAYRLWNVNPEQNWADLIMATEADMCIFGRAYWLKVRNDNGNVVGLIRLNPATVEIREDKDGGFYFIHTLDNDVRHYNRGEIVYFRNYHPTNAFEAVSPLDAAMQAIEVDIASDKQLKHFFENRAMPDYVIVLQGNNPKELKRLSAFWEKEFKGPENAHKTGWLGGGADVKKIGAVPKDLALSDLRAETRRAICAAFGVPPALVGAWEAANYATIREQRQSLYTEVLIPEARYLAGVINAELAPEFDDGEFVWKFEELPALQEDANSKAKRLAWLVEAGIIKPEVAAVELGYKPEDTPDNPPPKKPSDNNNFAKEVSDPSEQMREDKKTLASKQETALRKWRRKCLKRIKDGKSPLCDFDSQYVDDTLVEAIKGQLETAETKDDVNTIFETAVIWREYP